MISICGYRIRTDEILYYHGMKQGLTNPRYYTMITFKNLRHIEVNITVEEMDKILGII